MNVDQVLLGCVAVCAAGLIGLAFLRWLGAANDLGWDA